MNLLEIINVDFSITAILPQEKTMDDETARAW
jgi:hypothetical protein